MMRQTPQFHANAGDEIYISIVTDPIDMKVGIGLLQPDGYAAGCFRNRGIY